MFTWRMGTYFVRRESTEIEIVDGAPRRPWRTNPIPLLNTPKI
jgi:hypothetical protein